MVFFYNYYVRIVEYVDNEDIRKDVEPLFVSAFIEEERPPVNIFFSSLEKDYHRLFALYDNEVFIGFYYLTFYKDICYIYFLAIKEEYRFKGYGSKILQHIKETYPDYVLLLCYEDIDPKYPDYENRCKREGFYLKNGFIRNIFKVNEYGVVYQSAYYGKHTIPFSDYLDMFKMDSPSRAKKNIKEYK